MYKKLTWKIKNDYIKYDFNYSEITVSSPSSELIKKLVSIGDLQIRPDIPMHGLQMIVTLENGYKLSIIKHISSYGYKEDKWELAVIKNCNVVFDTDITSDVLGFLSDEEVGKAVEIANKMDENGKLPKGITIDSIYENKE